MASGVTDEEEVVKQIKQTREEMEEEGLKSEKLFEDELK